MNSSDNEKNQEQLLFVTWDEKLCWKWRIVQNNQSLDHPTVTGKELHIGENDLHHLLRNS